jgi:type I restriction enzyme S subunit
MHQLQPLFAAQAQGTTTKFVTIGILRNAPLMLPPLHEQLAIADILGTLDDKIELNRRMNETLEEIARTLFTSWFVTFDPVRAKAEGRQPEGMDAATAALFPDAFVDSELGEIPAGWRVSTVSFVVSKLNRGLSPSYVDEGGVLVINQKCIRDHRVDFAKTRRHNDNDRKVDGRLIEVGDIVVNSTGVGTLGRVAPVLRLREPTIVDSHVTIVRANPKQVPWQFLWFYFLHREPEIEQLGEGSTGQTELSRARLGDLSIVLPPASLLKRFVDTVEPLLELIAANQDMSETLAEIRDTLLPKLLSGEVRVPLDQPAEVALP